MDVDKVFKVKDSNRIHLEVHVMISQTVTDGAKIEIANKYEVTLSVSVFRCDLGPF